MATLNQTLRTIKGLVTAKTINGSSFVGVREYTNSKGEVSNQLLRVGYNYTNLLKKDFKKLQQLEISSVIEKYGQETATKAYEELLTSLAKLLATEEEKEELRKQNDSTMKRSDAQIDAHITLATGIQQNKESGKIFVVGICERKKVLVEGEYKKVNSRPKTLAKKDIKKLAELTNDKIRRFTFNDISEVKMQGVTI